MSDSRHRNRLIEAHRALLRELLEIGDYAIADWMTPQEKFRAAAEWILQSDTGKAFAVQALRATYGCVLYSYDEKSDTRRNLVAEMDWLQRYEMARKIAAQMERGLGLQSTVNLQAPLTPCIGMLEIWDDVRKRLGLPHMDIGRPNEKDSTHT